MADPLPEERTDGVPSHSAFSGMAEVDVDCPGFTYAELGASREECSSAPVEVYIPRPVEEPPVGTTSFGVSFSIPSWGISMSPLLDFPAQSAFQVGDTTGGGGDTVPNSDEESSPPLEVGAPPEHGIRWPAGAQPTPHFADDSCWEFLVGRITALVDSTDPAPIEVIREALEQHTGSAFGMGVQQERWMNFITDVCTWNALGFMLSRD
ncbi:hypothetical protein Taro_047794 [Colocasia esculenta]|uniref:Uncharacterized protein n=1 Tax=Colocasia esculenta TaxID=4460 RepID=A0A843X4C5_COLES|nr:hypothetical protein [Colocasia esculenta]